MADTTETAPMSLDARRSAICMAASLITDMLDATLEYDLSNDPPVIAMLSRSNELALAILRLIDERAKAEHVESARKTIYLGACEPAESVEIEFDPPTS